MEQYTSTDELKQAFKRPKDHLKEIDRLKPWGLSEEATFKMASENLREDGASPNGEPTTVNKLVAQSAYPGFSSGIQRSPDCVREKGNSSSSPDSACPEARIQAVVLSVLPR